MDPTRGTSRRTPLTLVFAALVTGCGGQASSASLLARDTTHWTSPSWPSTPVTGVSLWQDGDTLRGRLSFSGRQFEGRGRVSGSTVALELGDPDHASATLYRFAGVLHSADSMQARLTSANGSGAPFVFTLVREE